LSKLEDYLRGRQAGEISVLVKAHLLNKGVTEATITEVSDPLAGAKYALESAKKGDLLLLFVLAKRDQVHAYLMSQAQYPNCHVV
jgi:hypothetical protein